MSGHGKFWLEFLLCSDSKTTMMRWLANYLCLRCEIFGVFLLSFPQNERKTYLVLLSKFCSLCIFFEGSVFTFQFLIDKIHNHVFFYIIVNFIIQKLKSEHTSLIKYTNWAKAICFSLVWREREEKTLKYFAPRKLYTEVTKHTLQLRKSVPT